MPFFSNAFPVYSALQFPGLIGTFLFLHLGKALEHIKAICEENEVRETQGKTNGGSIWDEVGAWGA